MTVKREYGKDYQHRPARTQLDYQSSTRVEESGTYNVWFELYEDSLIGIQSGAWMEANSTLSISPLTPRPKKAEYRCIVERDAGRSKATAKQPFCVHFSHGRCTRGADCTFLHRIPMFGDRIETTIDCFGRDKYRTDRDDMGGIGSFERRCRTLYIGGVGMSDHMEEIVTAHCSEWGELEYVNVLPEKGVAFVQYKSILNAEFAKEAMQSQTLESDDIINVRWAAEDPNPGVQAAKKRKAELEVIETIKAQLPIIGDRGTILDYDESFQEAPKVRPVVAVKRKAGEMYFGEDLDAWQSYCEQYFEHYGVYPKGAEGAEVVEGSGGKDGGNDRYIVKAAPAKTALVVDYASSDDE